MPRQMLNVLFEGLVITAVLVAFLASSARVVRPAVSNNWAIQFSR
jgi:hypothetical protein